MSLAVLAINVLAGYSDQLHHVHHRRIHPSQPILDAFDHTDDPLLWVTLAQLVEPLPAHLHDLDVPLSHPALPSLQKISDTPHFSLVTIVSLPNCLRLHDDDVVSLRTLHRLIALDLRGCTISSYAITALSRALLDGGPRGLRLLSLYGCPNIDNDALPALVKFPLLSALDLRFTRCTPSAVNAHLSSLDFCPSYNSSLFHPASPSLAICTLEKIARSAPDPISLYSCPPQSVFRMHICDLGLPSRSKKLAISSSRTFRSGIKSVSSAEDTVVFFPPPGKPSKGEPPVPIDSATSPDPVSNLSSFYQNAPTQKKRTARLFPFLAQAVQPSESGQLDPLAVARSPPPWSVLVSTAYNSDPRSTNAESSQRTRSVVRWSGEALDKPLKVDRARLLKRGSDAMANLVQQSAKKRPKIESEFSLQKTRMAVSAKPCNPFSIKSVFNTNNPDKPPPSSSNDTKPDLELRPCRSLPSKTAGQQEIITERSTKPLKPITTLKPPILPKELLPPTPRRPSQPKTGLKQTRLSFG